MALWSSQPLGPSLQPRAPGHNGSTLPLSAPLPRRPCSDLGLAREALLPPPAPRSPNGGYWQALAPSLQPVAPGGGAELAPELLFDYGEQGCGGGGKQQQAGDRTPDTDVPATPASSVQGPPEPLEEILALPREGWLQVPKGSTDVAQRLAVWAAHPQSHAMGWMLKKHLWVWRYFELTDDRLCCWASPEQSQQEDGRPLQSLSLVEVDEVAAEGSELQLHFRNARACFCLRAESAWEAEDWLLAVRGSAGRALRAEFPANWDVHAMLSRNKDSARMVNKEPVPQATVDVVQRLVDHSLFCKYRTKDRRGFVPVRLQVLEVERVQNGSAWLEYSKERSRLRDRSVDGLQPLEPQVITATLGENALVADALGELDASSQEHWLFHGTTEASVQGISNKEFRMDFAGRHRGTLYGKGVYLAECSSKADEYAEEDSSGVCSMLLCRAALGRVLLNSEAQPTSDLAQSCRAGGFDSVCGDRWAAVRTYREFVVYQSSQVYPAYIIRYRRVAEAGLCMSIRLAADDNDVAVARHLVPYVARLAYEHPDREVRYRLTLLITSQDESTVPALAHALTDPRTRMRRVAAFTLAKLAAELGCVQCMDDGTLHRRTLDVTPTVAAAVPELAKCLADDDVGVRKASVTALEPLGAYASVAVPALIARLQDSDEDVRRIVALALGKLGAPAVPAVPALTERLEDEVKAVRAAAATGLGHLGQASASAALDLVRHLETDSAQEVRVAAAFALGQLGAHALPGLPALTACLGDADALVRKAAAHSVSFLGGRGAAAGPELVKCLKDADCEVRQAAAAALGQFGAYHNTQAAAAALSDGLLDSNPQVRKACAVALGRLGSLALPAVRRLATSGLADSSNDVRAAVAGALVDLVRLDLLGKDRELIEKEMTVRLKDHCDEVRKAAAMCLRHFHQEHQTAAGGCPAAGDVKVAGSWRRTEDQMRKLAAAYRSDKSPRNTPH